MLRAREVELQFPAVRSHGPFAQTEQTPLPKFSDLLVCLAGAFDPPAPDGPGYSWRRAVVAGATAMKTCPGQHAEVVAAALVRDVAYVGLPDQRGARPQDPLLSTDCRACAARPSRAKASELRGRQWLSALPGFLEVSSILTRPEGFGGSPGGRPPLRAAPLPRQVLVLCDEATELAWALGWAGALSREALVQWGVEVASREVLPQVLDAFLEAISGEVFNALVGGIDVAPLTSLSRAVGALGTPFSDAIGQLALVFGSLADSALERWSGRSAAISRLAVAIAREVKVSDEQVTLIKWAALIQDVSLLRSGAAAASADGRALLVLPSLKGLVALLEARPAAKLEPRILEVANSLAGALKDAPADAGELVSEGIRQVQRSSGVGA